MVQGVDAAKAVYEMIKAGDFAGVRAALAEDCVIEFPGPSVIPYAGVFVGRDKCMVFFDHVQHDVDILCFEQDEYFGTAERVCVTGRLSLRARRTGRLYDTDYAHVISLRGAQWTRFRDFADTATVMHAFLDTSTPRR